MDIISSHCLSSTLLTPEGRPQEGGVWALPPPFPAAQTGFPDRPGLHSPDTLVEDEELLVRQSLALKDSDHAVMDTVGRKESGHPEALGLMLPSRPASSHLSSPIQFLSAPSKILGVPTPCDNSRSGLLTHSGSPEPARHSAGPAVQLGQNFPPSLHVLNPPGWARY